MAKSEMPSIVVSSGSNSNHCCTNNHMERRQLGKLSRLAKQEEFELDESCTPSPVTIHIEDQGDGLEETERESNGGGRDDNDDDEEGDDDDGCQVEGDTQYCDADGNLVSQPSSPATGAVQANKADKDKQSRRMKLLVRSQAVRDDTSPPPDIESVSSNTNMLSVSNVSLYSSQPQSKGSSNRHRIGRQGSSQGSADGSSPSLSRDSSTETYTDSTGIDLQQFLIDTLQKNCKDRILLLKIEQELTTLVKDMKRLSFKFPQMSSYNRMLVHRVAAFFGLDHNVDQNGTAVIVNKTANTRIPDMKFRDQIKDELMLDEPKKSILKRDSASFEEGKEKSPERQFSADNKRSKSFEEREEEYEKARARIFNQDSSSSQEGAEIPIGPIPECMHSSSQRSSQEDLRWVNEPRPWSSTDSDSSGRPIPQPGMKAGGSFEVEAGVRSSGRPGGIQVLLKSDSDSKEVLTPGRAARPAVTKASSFGGISVLTRESSVGGGRGSPPVLTKAESFNITSVGTSRFSPNNPPPGGTPLQASTSPIAHSPSPKPPVSIAGPTLTKASSTTASNAPSMFQLPSGQPHGPLQQQPSSQSSWQAGTRDHSVPPEMLSQPVGQPPLWPWPSVDSIPAGSIILNPPLGTHYVTSDTPVYRPRSAPGISNQPVLVTPYQQVSAAPNLPQTLQLGSQLPVHPTPPPQQLPQASPSQQQPPPMPPQQQPQPPSQQPQQQQSIQQTAFQTTPAFVYIPCLPSPLQPTLATQIPFQQSSKGPQQDGTSEQRQEARNTGPGDLVTQMCSLNLSAPPVSPDAGGTCATGPVGPTIDSNVNPPPQPPTLQGTLSQQSILLPSVRSQGYVTQTGNLSQVPLCYVPPQQQQPQASASQQPVQYIYPTGHILSASVQQPPSSNSGTVVIGNQSVVDIQPSQVGASQGAGQQLAGQYYIPSYPLYSYSHGGEGSSSSAAQFLSYTVTSQNSTSTGTSTTSAMVSTASLSLPVYPYASMVVTSVPNGNTSLLTSPCTSQANQATNYVAPVQLPTHTSAVPLYVVATNNPATPVAIPPAGAVAGSACPAFRSSTPPNPNANAGQSSSAQPVPLGSPLVGYTIYAPAIQPTQPAPPQPAPPQQQQAPPPPQAQTSMTPGSHGSVTSTQFPLLSFPIIRPTIPLVSNVQTSNLPPNQSSLSSQFPNTPSTAIKGHTAFPYVRSETVHSGDSLLGNAGGSGHDQQHKGSRNTTLHLGTAGAQIPPGGSVFRRGISLMQDMRLIGSPLQHQLNPLLISQQRSLLRFPHPPTGSAAATPLGNRPPKMRKQRNKQGGGNAGSGAGSGSGSIGGNASGGNNNSIQCGSQISGDTANGGHHILEVEGLPDSMKRSEVERYLEQVTSLGAKIQFVCEGGDGGSASSLSGDFVVSSKYQVLAIFESETAAQSALLSIKTPKFQLRPLRRSRKEGRPSSKNL